MEGVSERDRAGLCVFGVFGCLCLCRTPRCAANLIVFIFNIFKMKKTNCFACVGGGCVCVFVTQRFDLNIVLFQSPHAIVCGVSCSLFCPVVVLSLWSSRLLSQEARR